MRRILAIILLVLTVVPATTAQASRSTRLRSTVLTQLNQVRAAHGLPPLRLKARLSRCALGHTRYLAQLGMLTHDSADGTSAAVRIRRSYNVPVVGETLAYGESVRSIVSMWMHSPEHRAILLDPAFHVIGIGAVRAGDGTIWATADLGS